MDRGSGVGGMPPPPHQQMPDAVGLAAALDPQFVMLRNNSREKIFEYIRRKPSSADWRRRLPELARRLEEILFRKFPNKREYYNMTLGPMEPHLQFAIKFLLDQNQQLLPTPVSTQGASENSGMSYATHRMGPSSFGACMVPQNANTVFLVRQKGRGELSFKLIKPNGRKSSIVPQHHNTDTQGEAPGEHVNTLLSLGMNSTHHHSRLSNNNPAPPAPVKEVPKEPKFSCPVCMNELVNASSTTCGHIFCEKCIRASILAQSKCPTCRRTLSLSSFHRVYLPMMD